MRPDDIHELLRAEPFRGFRLHLTDGATFEVHHPDQVVLTRSLIYLYLPPVGDVEHEAHIALIHIIWIEAFPLTSELAKF